MCPVDTDLIESVNLHSAEHKKSHCTETNVKTPMCKSPKASGANEAKKIAKVK